LKYAGMPCRSFFLFLNFVPAFINIYCIHSSLSIFLTAYPCFAFKKCTGISKFPFRALPTCRYSAQSFKIPAGKWHGVHPKSAFMIIKQPTSLALSIILI
jgi:hypothetical protein